jgi:hypothetical protein
MLPEPLAGWGVWAGGYGDFEPSWYASIGSNLVLVFLLEAFVTMFEESYDYYVRKKCMRCCNYPQIEVLNSHKVPMQHDLDGWEVGPYFSPTLNTAKLMALFFFTMMYAPGLPLLVPLCFLTFFMYFRSQKYLMLRYYMMPDPMGDGVMKYTLSLLPFAAILRLAMACWMLSNPNILPVEEQRFEMYGYVPGQDTTASYSKSLADQRAAQGGDVSTRLLRESVAPIFFLLLIVVVIKVTPDEHLLPPDQHIHYSLAYTARLHISLSHPLFSFAAIGRCLSVICSSCATCGSSCLSTGRYTSWVPCTTCCVGSPRRCMWTSLDTYAGTTC